MLQYIIDYIGFNGPTLLFFTSLYWLYSLPGYFNIYIIGFVINYILNYILKGLLRQMRPTDDEHLFALEKIYRKTFSFDKYGMPSCHTQLVFYSTIYIAFAVHNVWLTLFYVVISLLTMYQRVTSNQHFFSQTLVAAVVGMLVAYVFVIYARNMITGKIKRKKDDNGPV